MPFYQPSMFRIFTAIILGLVVIFCGIFLPMRTAEYRRYQKLKRNLTRNYQQLHQQGATLLAAAEAAHRQLPAGLTADERLLMETALASVRATVAQQVNARQLDTMALLTNENPTLENRGKFAVYAALLARDSQDPPVWQRARNALFQLVLINFKLNEQSALPGGLGAIANPVQVRDDVQWHLKVALSTLPNERITAWMTQWWEKAGQAKDPYLRAQNRADLFSVVAFAAPRQAGRFTSSLLANIHAVNHPQRRGALLASMREDICGNEALRADMEETQAAFAQEWASEHTSPAQAGDMLLAFAEGYQGKDDASMRKQLLKTVGEYYASIRNPDEQAWAMSGLAVAWIGQDNGKASKLMESNVAGLTKPGTWNAKYNRRLIAYFAALVDDDPGDAFKQYQTVSKAHPSLRPLLARTLLAGLPGTEWKRTEALLADAGDDPATRDGLRQQAATTLLAGKQVDRAVELLRKMTLPEYRQRALQQAAGFIGPEEAAVLMPVVHTLSEPQRLAVTAEVLRTLPPTDAWKTAHALLPPAQAAQAVRRVFGPRCFRAMPGTMTPVDDLLRPSKAQKLVESIKDPAERSFMAAMLTRDIVYSDPTQAVAWVQKNVKDPFWTCIAAHIVAEQAIAGAKRRWNWALQPEPEDRLGYVLFHSMGATAHSHMTDPSAYHRPPPP
ncbi:MAG: hypothetical protein ACYDBB_24875, partial [Armatimonadota bacterium]